MRSTRALAGSLGFLAIGVAVWGGIVAYVGPTFGFDMGGTHQAWKWTESHTILDLAPGILGIAGGLLLAGVPDRTLERLGAMMALVAGIWFTIGPTLEPLWQQTGIGTSGSDGSAGSRTMKVLEGIGYHYGTGAVLVLVAAFALGMLAAAPVARTVTTGPEEERAARQTSLGRPSHA